MEEDPNNLISSFPCPAFCAPEEKSSGIFFGGENQ
jgi:hypothetical protein